MRSKLTLHLVAIVIAVMLLFVTAFVGASPRESEQAGRRALVAGNYYEAIEFFSEALETNPRYLEALLGTAEAYLELNEPEVSEEFLTQAHPLAGNRPVYLLLLARVELARGRPAAAETHYRSVLSREPNNVDAQLGLAELRLADGKASEARRLYEDILRVSPQSRRGLLSLALLYDAQGDGEAAERYLLTALQYHRENPQVHLLAGEYYRARGLLSRAERHASTAVALAPEYAEALTLLARVFYEQDRYAEAVGATQQVIGLERNSPHAWYIAALSDYKRGRLDDAIDALEIAVELSPDREIIRLALEDILLRELNLEDERRAQFATYHFRRAAEFADRNYHHRASVSYRNGLQLDPYNYDARMAYADIFRLAGSSARYLQELEVLRDLGHDRNELMDRIETFSHLGVDDVAHMWGISQFDTPRDRIQISLFTVTAPNHLELPDSDNLLVGALRRHLLRYEQLAVAANPFVVSGFADAFARARNAGDDYFAVVRYDEADRNFGAYLTLYRAATGTEVARLSALRAGNDRVLESHRSIALQLAEIVPLRGRILDRRFERALINIGRLDGVEEGMELAVVRADSFDLAPNRPEFRYSEDAILGLFVVSGVDDLVSEGTVTRDGFFDLINQGDAVLAPKPELPAATDTDADGTRNLLERIRALLP